MSHPVKLSNFTKPIAWERRGSCLIATSHFINKKGYPTVRRNGQRTYISRMVCERRHGPLGELFALHSCDNPACINPDHLRPGTHLDNMADMVARGRNAHVPPPKVFRGVEKVKQAKLNDDAVRAIREAVGPQWKIGKRFGVSQSVVSTIKSRTAWRHVQ